LYNSYLDCDSLVIQLLPVIGTTERRQRDQQCLQFRTVPAGFFPAFAMSGSNLGNVLGQLDGDVGTGAERAAVG
jgi:hypothetical protein